MRSSDGEPMVCVGSTIFGPAPHGISVDQTPVEVVERFATAPYPAALVEFTLSGVSVFCTAANVTAIQPRWELLEDPE